MTVAEKLLSYEDLLALPEDVRAELILGSIQVSPAPLPRHSKVPHRDIRYAPRL